MFVFVTHTPSLSLPLCDNLVLSVYVLRRLEPGTVDSAQTSELDEMEEFPSSSQATGATALTPASSPAQPPAPAPGPFSIQVMSPAAASFVLPTRKS